MPDRFWGLPIDTSAARIALFYGLMESTSDAAPLSAPMTIDTWLSAAKGDPSGLWFLSLLAKMAFPQSFVWGELAAMGRADTLAAEALLRAPAAPQRLDPRQPGHGVPLRRRRPGRRLAGQRRTRTSTRRCETRTSRRSSSAARSTSRRPPRTRPASCCRTSATAVRSCSRSSGTRPRSGAYQPKASTRLLNTFLDTGKVDTSLYTPREGRLHARTSRTPRSARASPGRSSGCRCSRCSRCSLMWRRVRRRGRIGRTASVLLRSLFPVVLGLAGWFAGVVVVLFAFPSVPLDDAALAIFSVGTPDRRRDPSRGARPRPPAARTVRDRAGGRARRRRGSDSRPAPGFSP